MNQALESKETRIKGFYPMCAVDTKKIKTIVAQFSDLIESEGYLPYTFPTVGLVEDLEKEQSHFQMNAQVFRIEDRPWFLKPTSQAIAYPYIYGNQALKLPCKWYSIGPAFRNESKATTRLIRGKEISYFFEGHAVYSTEIECKKQVAKIGILLSQFLCNVGIPHRLFIRPLEDTFPGALTTYAFDTWVNDKAVQVATLHYLGTQFSEAYRANDHVYGLCFGFTERLLGVLKDLYNQNYRYFNNYYQIVEVGKEEKPKSSYPYVRMNQSLKKDFQWVESTYDSVFLYHSQNSNPTYRARDSTEETDPLGQIERMKSKLYAEAQQKVYTGLLNVQGLGALISHVPSS